MSARVGPLTHCESQSLSSQSPEAKAPRPVWRSQAQQPADPPCRAVWERDVHGSAHQGDVRRAGEHDARRRWGTPLPVAVPVGPPTGGSVWWSRLTAHGVPPIRPLGHWAEAQRQVVVQ